MTSGKKPLISNLARARLVAIALMLTVLGACASGPGYSEVSDTIQTAAKAEGRIYFYRPSSAGFAIQPMVRIDNEPVGKAKPKGFFYVDLAPGNYEISTKTEAKRNLSIALSAGEEKYVRLEMKMGLFAGHVKPVLVDELQGKKQLAKTSYAPMADPER
ncbi:MAG: DUF2846 domain-containing protein [Halioglobus sp.]